jgi:hypothetical protein
MRLGIQHPFVETDDIGRRVQQVKILEGLGQPEGFHLVDLDLVFVEDVVDGRVAVLGRRGVDDGLEHAPALVLPRLVAGYAVHVPYRLDGFGSVVSLEVENERRGRVVPEDVFSGFDSGESLG